MPLESLIVKYITRSITVGELDQLEEYLKDPVNDKVFKTFIELNYTLDDLMDDYDSYEAKQKVLSAIRKEKKHERTRRRVLYMKYASVAAVALLLISLPFVFRDKTFKENTVSDTNTTAEIPPGIDKAVLTLENGRNIVLKKGGKYNTEKVKSDGESLVYTNNPPDTDKETAYNYLTVPRGGQFYVQLPDSTRVWLNSESRLRYPVRFTKGRPRKVELVYGEAYFDVSSSTKHDNMPFSVQTGEQTVEVLGTEFNIKAYRDEAQISTTLVEGKVAVGNGTSERTMSPGQQSVVRTDKGSLEINNVNVAVEVAWKNGMFMFDGMSLGNMMKILSRWYDMEVKFEDDDKKAMVFSGLLKRSEGVNELLRNIEQTGEVSFQIENRVLIIK
ncbi:FecR family protein [Sinomicrobium weinanense]|uniref:FecR domain-containing protein n=1 Tax=Sinomicrobium weinanense TaxID=2842200 RepID=A0A926JQY6_9FLAO|nr:FecR domain-containing protein [Sinomicrobium weinanense]MBC9795823.1 FecR domain-containing protein [Sinomicrobium weinanense]MBU3121867.1 FecR domain-containing protein [Sinomicrobium weinanense]